MHGIIGEYAAMKARQAARERTLINIGAMLGCIIVGVVIGATFVHFYR